jgi:DNA polymerase elongation subunit (family B)
MKVVYGDTDTVFVNSNVTNFEDALRISAAFKKAVNEQYCWRSTSVASSNVYYYFKRRSTPLSR